MWDAYQQSHYATLNNTLIALYHFYTWLSAEPSGSETVHSVLFTAFSKNIADMSDLLKEMWFLMTIEVYKLWHKRTTSG
jgi:hypothetical protein